VIQRRFFYILSFSSNVLLLLSQKRVICQITGDVKCLRPESHPSIFIQLSSVFDKFAYLKVSVLSK